MIIDHEVNANFLALTAKLAKWSGEYELYNKIAALRNLDLEINGLWRRIEAMALAGNGIHGEAAKNYREWLAIKELLEKNRPVAPGEETTGR